MKGLKVFVYEKRTNKSVAVIDFVKKVELVKKKIRIISKDAQYEFETSSYKTTIYQN